MIRDGSHRPPGSRLLPGPALGVVATGGVLALLAGCGTDPDEEPDAHGSPGRPASSWVDEDSPRAVGEEPAAASAPGVPVEPPSGWVEGCAIDTVVDELDTREQVAQLLTVGVSSEADAVHAVRDLGIGGLFVGSDVVAPLLGGDRIDDIVGHSALPVSVAIDQEGGRVDRMNVLRDPVPAPRTMAQTMSPEDVRQLAAGVGEDLAARGVTIDFAPTIDVSDQAAGDVIGDRSFSADAGEVVDYGRAFAEGLRDAGVMPTYKHFPGHGRSSGDSHYQAVTIPPLDTTDDLAPFTELIGEPDAPVMVGHMSVPGLTAPDEPATLSEPVYDLLRSGGDGLPEFSGVVFTDDLSGMAAITALYPLPEAVLRSLQAGADSPLFTSTEQLPQVLDRVVAAVESGEYSAADLEESVRRVLAMRGCR